MVENKEQFGIYGLNPKGITIHNTGNDFSAQENHDILEHSVLSKACHFFIDENEIVQFMPIDWCVYHTGMAMDWACKNTIAIEICRSTCELDLYLQAEERAVDLMHTLMNEYNIPVKKIYFHKDWKKTTYCPHRILDVYGDKKSFLGRYF